MRILEYFSLFNVFKALIICSYFFQYISNIMMVVSYALDIMGKMLQNRSLKCLGLESGTTPKASGQLMYQKPINTQLKKDVMGHLVG